MTFVWLWVQCCSVAVLQCATSQQCAALQCSALQRTVCSVAVCSVAALQRCSACITAVVCSVAATLMQHCSMRCSVAVLQCRGVAAVLQRCRAAASCSVQCAAVRSALQCCDAGTLHCRSGTLRAGTLQRCCTLLVATLQHCDICDAARRCGAAMLHGCMLQCCNAACCIAVAGTLEPCNCCKAATLHATVLHLAVANLSLSAAGASANKGAQKSSTSLDHEVDCAWIGARFVLESENATLQHWTCSVPVAQANMFVIIKRCKNFILPCL